MMVSFENERKKRNEMKLNEKKRKKERKREKKKINLSTISSPNK